MAEKPEKDSDNGRGEFSSYADALWWGVVGLHYIYCVVRLTIETLLRTPLFCQIFPVQDEIEE